MSTIQLACFKLFVSKNNQIVMLWTFRVSLYEVINVSFDAKCIFMCICLCLQNLYKTLIHISHFDKFDNFPTPYKQKIYINLNADENKIINWCHPCMTN